MEKVALIYAEEYLKHETGRHIERASRLIRTLEVLENAKIYEDRIVEILKPRRALEEEVLEVHSENLLSRIRSLASMGGGRIAPDTVVSKYSYDVALLAAGGGLRALELVSGGFFKRVFVLCRPPGHHAKHDRAKGFCLINNIAVTAKKALKMGFKRVLILDFDSHHGDGTQKIFYENPNVVYASIHQDGRTLYPRTGDFREVGVGEGEGYKINIPLPPGSTGTMAFECLKEVILPIMEEYRPEMILVSAGYDGHWHDKNSDLMYTTETYYEFMREIVNCAKKVNDGKIITLLEGGYDLKYMPYSILRTLEAMSESSNWITLEGDPKLNTAEKRTVEILIKKAKKVLSKYWNI